MLDCLPEECRTTSAWNFRFVQRSDVKSSVVTLNFKIKTQRYERNPVFMAITQNVVIHFDTISSRTGPLWVWHRWKVICTTNCKLIELKVLETALWYDSTASLFIATQLWVPCVILLACSTKNNTSVHRHRVKTKHCEWLKPQPSWAPRQWCSFKYVACLDQRPILIWPTKTM